jgi:hypothetical protein
LLPLAFYGFPQLRKSRPALAWMLLFFAAGSFVCARLPFRFQWRFVEGLPQALGILAAFGFFQIRDRFSGNVQFAVRTILLAMLLGSAGVVLIQNAVVLSRKQPPQYLPEAVIAGMEEAGRISPRDAVFLCTEFTGNFLPAYSARAVVLGHRVQTVNAPAKRDLVQRILRTPANHALRPIAASRATWIFWGPGEKNLATGGFDPESAPYLKREFRNEMVAIYRILRDVSE